VEGLVSLILPAIAARHRTAFASIHETFTAGYGVFNVPPDTGDYGSPSFYTIAQTDGKLQIASTVNKPSLKTASTYTIQGCALFARIVPPMTASTDSTAEFIINSGTSGTRLVIRIKRNIPQVVFANEVASTEASPTTVPYDTSTMVFFRFREASGSLYFETSADGSSWTTRRTISTPAWVSTPNQNCEFAAYTSTSGGTITDFGLMEIQSVNVVESLSDPLSTWHTALAASGTTQARVLVIGDSIFEGVASTTRPNSFMHQFLSVLLDKHPVSGYGRCEFFPAYYFGPDWGRWEDSTTGTVTEHTTDVGLGRRAFSLATNATVTYTVTGTDVDVWTAAGGTCAVSIDGGTYGTPFTPSNAYGEIAQVSLGSTGSHTVTIKATAGPLLFLGLTVYDGGRAKSIVVYDYTRSGAACTSFHDPLGVNSGLTNELPRYADLIDPHLVIIKLGGNDAGDRTATQYQGDLTSVRDAIEGVCSPSFLYVTTAAEDPSGPDDTLSGGIKSPYYQYFDAMEAVAAGHSQKYARESPPQPLSTDAPGFYSGTSHMTDMGQLWLANFMAYHIDPLYGEPGPMGYTGTLPGGTVGVAYSANLTVTGLFVEPVTPGLATGSLPSWMSAAYNTGAGTVTFSGTPDAAATTTFTPKVTDSTGTPQVANASSQSVVIGAGGGGGSFAVWDATRKGSGVALTGSDLIATITGLFMVAATHPIDISGATGYYAEFTSLSNGAGTFMGIGLAKSGTDTSSYLGSASNQYCMWEDASNDTGGGGITQSGNLWNYASSKSAGIKIAIKGNKLWIGKIGTGWRNPNVDDFSADPTAGTNFILSTFAAGLWSIGVSCIGGSTEAITANFGGSSFADTPPSGFVGFPS
jgi:lysophospholipase L1-like esterase